MSAQLVMAVPGQPVIHDAIHDLESLFYVLIGICTLFDGPFKQKSEEELAQCYDKYFNTYEPSVLKTIAIQSDLTWIPFIVDNIHPYFKPIIPLLTALRSEIILPLYTGEDRQFHRRSWCNHDTFIKHIITALAGLSRRDWTDRSLKMTSDGPSRRPSSAIPSTESPSEPPEDMLKCRPPVAWKNLLPGRGIIRSDPVELQSTEKKPRRRERENDADEYLPPSPSKRTRTEQSESYPQPRVRRLAHSTSELPTQSSTSRPTGCRLVISKAFGQ